MLPSALLTGKRLPGTALGTGDVPNTLARFRYRCRDPNRCTPLKNYLAPNG